VAWDPPGPTFREEKFAAYKETRAPTPNDLRTQIPLVKTLFEALRLPLLEVAGFEADDVLARWWIARAICRSSWSWSPPTRTCSSS